MRPFYEYLVLLYTIIGFTCADLSSSISDVQSSASNIKEKVDNWSSKDGLIAALGIQNSFGGLNTAVNSLATDSKNVEASQLNVGEIQSLATAIDGLLNSLSKKSGDFASIGAKNIVGNDISSLSTIALDIVNNFAKDASGDCSKAEQLQPALIGIGSSFDSINSDYGLSKLQFPTTISCTADKNVGRSVAFSTVASNSGSIPKITATRIVHMPIESTFLSSPQVWNIATKTDTFHELGSAFLTYGGVESSIVSTPIYQPGSVTRTESTTSSVAKPVPVSEQSVSSVKTLKIETIPIVSNLIGYTPIASASSRLSGILITPNSNESNIESLNQTYTEQQPYTLPSIVSNGYSGNIANNISLSGQDLPSIAMSNGTPHSGTNQVLAVLAIISAGLLLF